MDLPHFQNKRLIYLIRVLCTRDSLKRVAVEGIALAIVGARKVGAKGRQFATSDLEYSLLTTRRAIGLQILVGIEIKYKS